MNTRQLTITLPGDECAILILPEPLDEQALHYLEQALPNTLRASHGLPTEKPVSEDPCALEVGSWLQHLLATRA